jgi:hypothetical protein
MDGSHSGQRSKLNRKDYLGNGRTGKIGQPWFATGHFGRGSRSSLRGGWHIYTASTASRLTNRALPRGYICSTSLPLEAATSCPDRQRSVNPKKRDGWGWPPISTDTTSGAIFRKARGKDVCRIGHSGHTGLANRFGKAVRRTGNAARRRRSTPLTLLALPTSSGSPAGTSRACGPCAPILFGFALHGRRLRVL